MATTELASPLTLPLTVAGSSRRGRHARSTRWSRHGADATALFALGAVAAVRIISLGIRSEPTGVDMGNWLMIGHALIGEGLPHAVHIVYPPLVPLLATGLAHMFGPTWGSAVLMGFSGALPGIGLYLAARMNRLRWPAVAPAVLLAATSSTGEAVAWGGAPQLIGLGLAVFVVGSATRLLHTRSIRHAVVVSASLFALAATSHLVFAQTVLALVILVPVVIFGGNIGRFNRATWTGWLSCAVVIAAPLVLLLPIYVDLLSTVGSSFASQSNTGPGWSSLKAFVGSLTVIDRDAPWMWRPAILVAAFTSIGFALTHMRRHVFWPPTMALTLAVVIQAIFSTQERLVYLTPLAVACSLVLLVDTAGHLQLHSRRTILIRDVVIGFLSAAVVAASVTGLAYFPTQRDFYARSTPPGTVADLDWIREHTPPKSLMLVAPVNGSPFGWWVQGYGRRSAYVGSEDRWLNFPAERKRAQDTIAVLSTPDLFGPPVIERLKQLRVDYLVLPHAWGGVSHLQLQALERKHPRAIAHNGKALTVIDVSELNPSD